MDQKATPVSVFIDSNAWNVLYQQEVDLRSHLPVDGFSVFITREVEVEILAIPDNDAKAGLKHYIMEALQSREVTIVANIGFREAGPTSAPLGHGTFRSAKDRAWYARPENQRHILGKIVRPTGLGKNEADASLAVRADRSIILTNDKKGGPLADAARAFGTVVSLANFDGTRMPLSQYISERIREGR